MIGGPNTILPKPIESFLSWSLCISCLSVSGYHYYVTNYIKPLWMKIRRKQITNTSITQHGSSSRTGSRTGSGSTTSTAIKQSNNYCEVPLTTYSRAELHRRTPGERYSELIQMMYYFYLQSTSKSEMIEKECSRVQESESESKKEDVVQNLDDDTIVSLIRSNTICRRLVSLIMTLLYHNDSSTRTLSPPSSLLTDKCISSKDNNHAGLADHELYDKILVQRLVELWPRLVELPPTPKSAENELFHISLVVPCYNESSAFIQKQLKYLMDKCRSPQFVEVIVVNAGGSNNDIYDKESNTTQSMLSLFGDVQVLSFTGGGGRGPTMNYGANAARGLILTFCHLDTRLPHNWDVKICDTLMYNAGKQGSPEIPTGSTSIRANSCAFSFGIDTSPEGILNPFTSDCLGYYPPGIKAVETTANIRTQLFSLPYGDQAISIAKNVFDFVGGFPDQCLMEDYELVALLRKRASLMTKCREQLKIIPGEPSLCSPRRWQKFGVLFVTYTNSKLVNLYAGGMSSDDLYRRYYGRDPPDRDEELSPWEVEMARIVF